MADADNIPGDAPAPVEHLNIKVTDNNNEVFFKIKRSTQLKKLMDAFCDRQGKQMSTVRFLFDGTRVRPEDTPDTVRLPRFPATLHSPVFLSRTRNLRAYPIEPQTHPPPHFQTIGTDLLSYSWKWPTAIPLKSTRSKSAGRKQDEERNERKERKKERQDVMASEPLVSGVQFLNKLR